MGVMQAQAFADAVGDEEIGLRVALEWHLTANHYPPLPVEYVDVAVACIVLAEDAYPGDREAFDQLITLPRDIRVLPREVEVVEDEDGLEWYACRLGTLIEILHLDSFIEWQEV